MQANWAHCQSARIDRDQGTTVRLVIVLPHGTEPDRSRAVRRWFRELDDQHTGGRRRQRADRRRDRRHPARPGDRAGGDDDQRSRQPRAHDPAVALDRLAGGALVPAGRDSGRGAGRLVVRQHRHALAADRAGAVPDQHRLAVSVRSAATVVRDAAAMVSAGVVRLRRDIGGGGRERAAGEPVLSQLRPNEGVDAGNAGGELARDPTREDRARMSHSACCTGGWRGTDWWPARAPSSQSGLPIPGCDT